MSTNRRTFLAQSAKATAGLCLLGQQLSSASKDTEHGPDLKFPATPKERICIASYPFREFITGPDVKAGAAPPMDLKDFAAHAKERFTIDKIEPWSGHFPSTDPKYIEQFRLTVDRAQCYIVNMAVDGDSSPYAADSAQRIKAVDPTIEAVMITAYASVDTAVEAAGKKPRASRTRRSRTAPRAACRSLACTTT